MASGDRPGQDDRDELGLGPEPPQFVTGHYLNYWAGWATGQLGF